MPCCFSPAGAILIKCLAQGHSADRGALYLSTFYGSAYLGSIVLAMQNVNHQHHLFCVMTAHILTVMPFSLLTLLRWPPYINIAVFFNSFHLKYKTRGGHDSSLP